MFNLQQAITGIKVGKAAVYGGLAVFPLIGRQSVNREYLTLTEAFGLKGVTVTEVSDGGSVPELKFKNLLDKDVFAADGETLVGAKQNRVLNSSIYVKAGDEIVIPVSCVEQGRWSYDRDDFEAGDYSEFVASRAAKMASVAASLRSSGKSRAADQCEVWDQVEAKLECFEAEAPTLSLHDVYAARRPSLDQYLDHVKLQPNQVGLACAINGKTAGIELFEETGVFSQFFERLIRAYAAEVVDEDSLVTQVPNAGAVKTLLDKVARLDCEAYDAVGSGKELRFKTGRLNGAALEVEGRLLHMVLLSGSSRHAAYH
jgi:hypothetical protein